MGDHFKSAPLWWTHCLTINFGFSSKNLLETNALAYFCGLLAVIILTPGDYIIKVINSCCTENEQNMR